MRFIYTHQIEVLSRGEASSDRGVDHVGKVVNAYEGERYTVAQNFLEQGVQIDYEFRMVGGT